MAGWLDTVMSPLNAAGEAVQKLIDTRDLVKFGDTFRKLLAEILSAQRGALTAQQREMELLNRIGELEKEVTRFETWERERQRYERRNVGYGAYAYILKQGERGSEEPYWACTNCYENGKITTLQYGQTILKDKWKWEWRCPHCKNTMECGKSNAVWIDDDTKKPAQA